MPRKSKAAMQVVQLAESARPGPPKMLTRKEKALWREIVNSLPGDYFRASDRTLLANYCRFSVRSDDLAVKLVADPENSELDKMCRAAVSTVSSLATKLRLCPNARIQKDSQKLKSKTTAKPWDNQRNS